ncbi:MAG TPA: hypothetical protein VF941_06620 [Clostridia bacterium]
MNDKQIIVKCCKCVLVFDNAEQLKSGLKLEALEMALRKGKGYRRAESVMKRQSQNSS